MLGGQAGGVDEQVADQLMAAPAALVPANPLWAPKARTAPGSAGAERALTGGACQGASISAMPLVLTILHFGAPVSLQPHHHLQAARPPRAGPSQRPQQHSLVLRGRRRLHPGTAAQ